jgi:hypothetical protein
MAERTFEKSSPNKANRQATVHDNLPAITQAPVQHKHKHNLQQLHRPPELQPRDIQVREDVHKHRVEADPLETEPRERRRARGAQVEKVVELERLENGKERDGVQPARRAVCCKRKGLHRGQRDSAERPRKASVWEWRGYQETVICVVGDEVANSVKNNHDGNGDARFTKYLQKIYFLLFTI